MMTSKVDKAFAAVAQRDEEVLIKLLQEGVSINVQDHDGNTLLISAAKEGTVFFPIEAPGAKAGVRWASIFSSK